MTDNMITIDASVIVPYAHAAFAAGYALYGPSPATEEAKQFCIEITEFAMEHIHDTNVLKFAEAKGNQKGLFDALYVRRDRLWMKYNRRSQRWAKQFAQDVPKSKILDVIRRYAPMSEATVGQHKTMKQEILDLLLAALNEYSDLKSTGRALALQAMTEGAAEGNTAASAMIQQLVGKHLPNLDDVHAAHLRKIASQTYSWSNADLVLKTQLSGLAGDLYGPISAMIIAGESQQKIEAAIEEVIAKGDGSSFYLDAAVHGSYAQAQLNTYERSGSAVDFLTVGDNRVCPQCIAIEDKNPWKVADVPVPPVHGNCRCWLAPAGTVS